MTQQAVDDLIMVHFLGVPSPDLYRLMEYAFSEERIENIDVSISKRGNDIAQSKIAPG